MGGFSAYQFTGQEFDHSSELYNYGARSYDPALSRFVSIDPVEENPPYAYTFNNPVTFIDPDGRDPGLYSEEVYGEVLDYRAEYHGDDPPSDLVQQWQAGSELWLRFMEFGIILAGNSWRPKIPKGTLEQAFKKSGSIAGVAKQLGEPETTVRQWLRRDGIVKKGSLRSGPEPRTTLGELHEAIVEAEGNLTKAEKLLGYEGDGVIRERLRALPALGGETLYDVTRRRYPVSPGVGINKGLDWPTVQATLNKLDGKENIVREAAENLHVSPKPRRYWRAGHYPGGLEQCLVQHSPPRGGRPPEG
jgi:RHS repeat-associated protein